MTSDVEKLVRDYHAWLARRTSWRAVADWFEITTPFLDRHNDALQIYVRRNADGWELTDDGNTLSDLEISGCRLETPKRSEILQEILNGFGVARHSNTLYVNATDDNTAEREHSLLQAMLAVGEMANLSERTVADLFRNDVSNWLSENQVNFKSGHKIRGKTGFEIRFDFVVPRTASSPERLINIINDSAKDRTENTAFKFIDVKGSHPESRAFVLINDQSREVAAGTIEALEAYDIRPVLWTKRESILDELAA